MTAPPECPRCAGPVRAPGLWSSQWRCEAHGEVEPLHPPPHPGRRTLAALLEHARVPVWLPDPLPDRWLVTGFRHAGGERAGGAAVVLAASGPCPAGGPADLLVVAEEPGVGLGARYAGIPGPDPCPPPEGPAAARIHTDGHPTALWSCPGAPPDRAVLVGEAKGLWLWLILFPLAASLLVEDHLVLRDAREWVGEVPFGALTPRLADRPGTEPPAR